MRPPDTRRRVGSPSGASISHVVLGLGVVHATALGRAGQGVTALHRHLVFGLALVERCVGAGLLVAAFHLGVGLGLGQGRLGFLLANILVVARLVVAAFLGDVVVGFSGLGACFVLGLGGSLVAGLCSSLGFLARGLGFGLADVLGIAGQRIALLVGGFIGGLGRGLGLVVGGLVAGGVGGRGQGQRAKSHHQRTT